MSFGAIAGTVVAGVATSAISSRLNRSSRRATQPVENFRPAGFRSPGLSVIPRGDTVNITRGSELSRNLNGLSGATSTNLNDLAIQRRNISSGFGEINDANSGLLTQRIRRIQDASRASLSNLRDNLARRGISGSSFATDSLARAEAEFTRQEDLARAENAQLRAQNVLAEIEAQTNLINQQFTARVGQFSAFIDQANFESGIGSQITSGVTTALQNSASTLAELRSQEAAGRGRFFQPVVDAIGSSVSQGVQNLFPSSNSGGAFLIPNSS